MILLDNGLGVQNESWKVTETNAAGYSRVYYIISGDITYFDDITQKKLLKGKMYVFPQSKPYSMIHNPKKPIECLWLHIDFYPYSVDRLIEFDIDGLKGSTIFYTVNALKSEGKFFKDNDSLYISLAEALYYQIIKHPYIRKPDTAFMEILNYIRNNIFDQTLNVLTVSSYFGYSTSHFIRMFKSFMNTTPHRYISLLRMSSAAKLLTEGSPVTDTAVQCGFTDVKTFSRAFKKNYGVAPSDYKNFYSPKA